jgi:hypothetical protein
LQRKLRFFLRYMEYGSRNLWCLLLFYFSFLMILCRLWN